MLLTLEVVIPVFAVVAVGYFLGSNRTIQLSTLSELAILITAPCFIFDGLSQMDLHSAAFVHLVGGTIWTVLILGVLSWFLVSRRQTPMRGFVLSSSLWNAGNLPLPCAKFAFGTEGLQAATLVFVTVATLQATLGIGIAKGRGALGAVVRLPLLYASLLGVSCAWFDWTLPRMVSEPIRLLGQMAIPMMLLCLGLQLRSLKVRAWKPAVAVAALRVLGGLGCMALFVAWFDVQGTPRQVLLLNSIMPPAVINYVIARRYSSNPELVASAIVLTTLLTVITMPLMLWWLMQPV